MRCSINWIANDGGHRLGIMPRPRAGDWLADEVALWKQDGVGAVISLLEAEEVEALELADEAGHCRACGIDFISFPIPDRGVPGIHEAKEIAALACKMLAEGQAVAIHCRAGIGRSSLMAGAVMVLLGIEPSNAFSAIEHTRGLPVPDTEEQREWLHTYSTMLTN